MGFNSEENAGQSILVIYSLSSSCRTSAVRCWSCIAIHKNEVWSNSISEQTHMRKDYLLTIVIFGYKTLIENVELCPPVQHNVSSYDNSMTTIIVSFRDVTEMKLCPGPGVENHKMLYRSSLFFSKVVIINLFNSCTYGLEGFPSSRNNTFVESKLFSSIGESTPLQHSDHSSMC
ncbi:hypothetical protein TNCV_1728351 [Trichonephila clavipes]|nr:hypothetical protein TNCV_1728351 [Trichonephila clavipes]